MSRIQLHLERVPREHIEPLLHLSLDWGEVVHRDGDRLLVAFSRDTEQRWIEREWTQPMPQDWHEAEREIEIRKRIAYLEEEILNVSEAIMSDRPFADAEEEAHFIESILSDRKLMEMEVATLRRELPW
jgi:hypothetical protein